MHEERQLRMEGDRPNRSVGCLQLFQEANSEYGAYASTRHYMSGGTNWYGTCLSAETGKLHS